MKRRKFLVASGSGVLTGSTLSSLQRPSLGIEFEISSIPNERPAIIDSLLIKFTQFRITPQYLDESASLDITVELQVQGESPVIKEVDGVNFTNGSTLDKTEIEDRSETDLTNVVIDGIDKSGSNLSGGVIITLTHPSISEKTYQRSFNINQFDNVIFEGFETGSLGSEWQIDNDLFEIDQDFVYEGNYSFTSDIVGLSAPESIAYWEPSELDGGRKISRLEYYWLEEEDSFGGGIGIYDSNGNPVLGSGSDNPQWYLSNGLSFNKIYEGDGYERWIRYTLDIDWEAGTYDYDCEDLQSGSRRTGTLNLNNSTNASRIWIRDMTAPNSLSSGSWSTSNSRMYHYFDNINVEL